MTDATPSSFPLEPAMHDRLERLFLDGQNLRGLTGGQSPDAKALFRKRYLAWHHELLRALTDAFPDERTADHYQTTRWQLVVGGRVTEDEVVRTILGDVESTLTSLRRLIDAPVAVPPRVLPDPATVGVAVYDANCLFSKHGRYLLLAFAVHGVVIARWSQRLLEETAANLAGKLRGDSLEDLGRWLKTEADLVRDGLVDGYERWLAEITLPDPGDTHVLAAAIEAGATTIVTSNRRHFPADELSRYGIVAVDPDNFSVMCIDANPVIAERIVTEHPEPETFLGRLASSLPQAAQRLRTLVS